MSLLLGIFKSWNHSRTMSVTSLCQKQTQIILVSYWLYARKLIDKKQYKAEVWIIQNSQRDTSETYPSYYEWKCSTVGLIPYHFFQGYRVQDVFKYLNHTYFLYTNFSRKPNQNRCLRVSDSIILSSFFF